MTRHALQLAAFAFAAAACTQADSARTGVSVSNVVAPAPIVTGAPAEATMAVYATIENHGSVDDTLTGVETTVSRGAAIHTTMDHGGMSMMMLAEDVVVPASSTIALAPGGTHVMLESLERRFVAGDSVALTLVFRLAGRVPVVARVVAYDQLESALRESASP